MVMDFKSEYNIDSLYELIEGCIEIDELLDWFKDVKKNQREIFNGYIEKMKILFILSKEYSYISTSAIVFKEFKIHSSVPLIVAKLLSGKFNKSGGTLLYSLSPLKKKYVIEELKVLWDWEISWEMEQMLIMMNIDPPRSE